MAAVPKQSTGAIAQTAHIANPVHHFDKAPGSHSGRFEYEYDRLMEFGSSEQSVGSQSIQEQSLIGF